VAAALYSASATQAASEKLSDAKLRAQRKAIEEVREKLRTSSAAVTKARSQLSTAQEKYVANLAERDRAYGEEIAVFRAAVEDIAATPEGVAALARFNSGDEKVALAILDSLRKARDTARQKRARIESAAEARRIATLALDARAKGKETTDHVITRYEEVTRLDPGVSRDWVELSRLYQAAGDLTDASAAAKHAGETAKKEGDQETALDELGDVQTQQGTWPGRCPPIAKAWKLPKDWLQAIRIILIGNAIFL
jgi:hypothetical protein